MYNSLDTPVSAQTPGVARGACNSSAAGLASLVTAQVPQELYARPVDGPPETAPNCEALTPKAKATAGEPIRTPRHVCGGVSVICLSWPLHRLLDHLHPIRTFPNWHNTTRHLHYSINTLETAPRYQQNNTFISCNPTLVKKA